MDISIEVQEALRDGVLQNIEINTIEALVGDRLQLLAEMNRVLERVVEQQNIYLNSQNQNSFAEMMADEILGYGPLRPLLEDETVSDILVNGPENIYIQRAGKLELTKCRFINNNQLTDIAKRLVQRVGRRLDEGRPLVDARLHDGSRLNVAIPPIALDGTSISIRKFGKSNIELSDLIRMHAMSGQMANFLIIAARCRVNIRTLQLQSARVSA